MPTRDIALDEVRLVTPVVHRDLLLHRVEFDDPRHCAREELPIVTDDHQCDAGLGDELFELFEPGQVQIVRRFVEQQHVVSRQQQCCQACAGSLPARQAFHRCVETHIETEIGDDLLGSFGQIGAAEREPPFERRGVVVDIGSPQGFGRRVHDVFGFGDSGASSQETEDRFAGYALGLLREVADGRVGRAQRDGAGDVRVARACQSREQGRLAGAVGADQTDHVAGRDCQVQPVEQGAFTAGGRQVADT